jgi:hypothetical protein
MSELATPVQWRTVRSLAERECEHCAHAAMHAIEGLQHRLCRSPKVLASFDRDLVATGVARDDFCRGKLWRPQT